MTYRSQIQPYCRVCGKPIAKHTRNVWIEREPKPYHENKHFSRYVYGTALNKQDCKRYTNEQVVALRYTGDSDSEKRQVRSFSEWDGESYKDQFFCSDPCAVVMAYGALKLYPDLHFPSYAKQKKG